MGRSDVTDSQFRRMRDSLYHKKTDTKKLSNSTFEQRVKGTFYKLCEEKVSNRKERASKKNSVVSGSDNGF